MPETIPGLWRQRLRWAQGGNEVLRKYGSSLLHWNQRRIWPIYLEYVVSVLWAYLFTMTVVIYLLDKFVALPPGIEVRSILPGWTGVILAVVCLFQVLIGLLIDSKFEKGIVKMFFWLIWYPAIYWVLNAAVTIIGLPKALLKKRGTPAIWESPDRGF